MAADVNPITLGTLSPVGNPAVQESKTVSLGGVGSKQAPISDRLPNEAFFCANETQR
jgi:hypothetical protein